MRKKILLPDRRSMTYEISEQIVNCMLLYIYGKFFLLLGSSYSHLDGDFQRGAGGLLAG